MGTRLSRALARSVLQAPALRTIPTPEEVGKLLANAEGAWVAFVAVCAFAGLRRGEAVALRLSDVDFLKREIHVKRQAQECGGGPLELRPPKYGSERTVYAPDQLLALLSEHVRQHRPGDDPDRWLFPGKPGQPIGGMLAEFHWAKARSNAGVGCKLHDLRHFYASGLIAAGCDVVTAQKAMGHGNAAVTLGTYSHLWPNADSKTREAAAAMIAEAMGNGGTKTATVER